MSKLDELIAELCPEGVEFRKLSEVFNTRNGYTPSKSKPEYWENGEVPWFRMEDIRENGNILNDAIQKVARIGVKGEPFPAYSFIVATSATIGEHALITVPSLSNQRFTYLMLKPEYKDLLDVYFLNYYFYNLDKWCLGHLNQGNFASVDMRKFYEFEVPVPPVEVQREIVRVLDNFLLLRQELSAELSARRKQYEYYREKMLSNVSCNPRMVRIGDLGKWTGGKTPSMAEPHFWRNGTIPWISSKDMKSPVLKDTEDHITEAAINEAGMNLLPVGTVAIVTRSGILKHTFPVAYIPFETTINQDIKALIHNDDVNPRYAAFALQGFGEDIRRRTKKLGGTVDSLDFDRIKDYEIPLPSMEIQNKIVDVLDNFEAICNDLNIGLPAEIEARTKQYEFYRDQLLTFAESGKTILTTGTAQSD